MEQFNQKKYLKKHFKMSEEDYQEFLKAKDHRKTRSFQFFYLLTDEKTTKLDLVQALMDFDDEDTAMFLAVFRSLASDLVDTIKAKIDIQERHQNSIDHLIQPN